MLTKAKSYILLNIIIERDKKKKGRQSIQKHKNRETNEMCSHFSIDTNENSYV